MGDMCKYWGIIPQERIDVVNKINSRAIVTHAKAQTLLWFGILNDLMSTQWGSEPLRKQACSCYSGTSKE